jgi:hypothetical protein
MEALLEAASEDTREDPDFDDPDDLDFSVDQDKVMRAAYAVFENEVSGMDHKMIAAHYASLFADLSAEAAGNATSNRSSMAKRNHAGETASSARAATSEKRFLNEEAGAVQRTPRKRKPPETFVAEPTKVNGSRKGEPERRPPVVVEAKQPRAFNKDRAARRKAAREEYIASLKSLADDTFVDLSWQTRKVVAVCAYARALEGGCGKLAAASIAGICARVDEKTVRRYVKTWLANEGFFHPLNWGMNRKSPCFLDDERIKLKASQWLRLNTGFKKGARLC